MEDRIGLKWLFPEQGRWHEMDPFRLPAEQWSDFYRVGQPPIWRVKARFKFWRDNHVLRERMKFYGVWRTRVDRSRRG